MTGEPELQSLQLGFSNAATLQEKTGIPAILFGLVQFAVLLAIYRAIRRRERPGASGAAGGSGTAGGSGFPPSRD